MRRGIAPRARRRESRLDGDHERISIIRFVFPALRPQPRGDGLASRRAGADGVWQYDLQRFRLRRPENHSQQSAAEISAVLARFRQPRLFLDERRIDVAAARHSFQPAGLCALRRLGRRIPFVEPAAACPERLAGVLDCASLESASRLGSRGRSDRRRASSRHGGGQWRFVPRRLAGGDLHAAELAGVASRRGRRHAAGLDGGRLGAVFVRLSFEGKRPGAGSARRRRSAGRTAGGARGPANDLAPDSRGAELADAGGAGLHLDLGMGIRQSVGSAAIVSWRKPAGGDLQYPARVCASSSATAGRHRAFGRLRIRGRAAPRQPGSRNRHDRLHRRLVRHRRPVRESAAHRLRAAVDRDRPRARVQYRAAA
ncbi:MAG: hypothetical protein BWZ10_02012 [candidate division BRC1 bacterium ADurb.BinA364]|nr:MAG: hypothetical protein BWZ10_02012 [candidate division BRC1 bacterium ADurb.BinA364]